MKAKLAVFFPGNLYTVKEPLFYYADLLLKTKGFEVLAVSYDHVSESEEDWIATTGSIVLEWLNEAGAADCEQLVFISKSIGSVIAGEISAALPVPVKNIFLSPLKGTLPFMEGRDCLVIAGTKDRLLDAQELKDYCEEKQVRLVQFTDAGHAIVDRSDAARSVRIQEEIVRLMDEYIG